MSLTVQEETTLLSIDQQTQSLEVRSNDPASVLEINPTVFALGICDTSQPAVLNIEEQNFFLTVEAQDEPSVLEIPQPSVLVVIGPAAQGPVGPKGDSGAAASAHVHTQSSDSATWTINHNLGYRPIVEVFNSGWAEVDAAVTNTSDNQTVITFSAATTGFARLI